MRVNIGGIPTVTTQERWLVELRAGRCFGGADSFGPIAAQFPQLQLENPLGSAKTVLPYKIFISSPTAQLVSIRYQTALLATLVGTCKNLSGTLANSTAQLRQQGSGAIANTLVSWMIIGANVWSEFDIPWLAELAPADTIWASGHTLNTQLVWSVYFNEF